MYAEPENLPVRARKLIEGFEKGELHREYDDNEEEEEEPKVQHSEKYVNELAHPGTTKKRMMELEKRKLEAEKNNKGDRHSSTGRLSQEMFGDFASDRLKKGEGPKHHGDAKNGVSIEIKTSETIAIERNRKELHKEQKHNQHEDVFQDHVERISDELNSRKTRVLVVSSIVPKPSALDKALVEMLTKTMQESDREILITDLNDTEGNSISYVEEQRKLHEADLVIFHFRPVLHTLPAKLMEWLQNVLVEHFAYDRDNGNTFDNGLMRGKRGLLLVTLAEDGAAFAKGSLLGDLSQYLWPIQNGILRFVGLSVLSPQIVYVQSSTPSDGAIEDAVSGLRKRLDAIWREKSLFSHPEHSRINAIWH